jgi:hypothetical protein
VKREPTGEARRSLDRLRALAGDREAQSRLAVEAIAAGETNPDVLQAALRVLAEYPRGEAHEALAHLYHRLDENGRKRDPGAPMRAAVVRALQPIVSRADLPLLQHAAETVEPGQEGTAMLRGAAVVAMNVVDDDLAGIYAVRMLGEDPARVHRMTGEPALTGARVLAAAEKVLPLYLYALTSRDYHPEVLAECIRGLAPMPGEFLAEVVERYASSPDETVLLGVCDLLVEHAADNALLPAARTMLAAPYVSAEVFHYFVAAVVAARRADLMGLVLEWAKVESRREHLRALAEALPLARGDDRVEAVLTGVRRQLEAPARAPARGG